MEKAIVLMHHPNGMPAMHVDPNLRAGDIDLGRTFNAMRDKQRKRVEGQSDFWRYMAINSANSAGHLGAGAQNSALGNMQGIGLNTLSGVGQSASMSFGRLYTSARQSKNVDEL